MRCKCKLFNVAGVPASDGSIIPRDVLEAYLSSEEYRNAIESRKMLGSLTHRARNLANAPADFGAALNKTVGKDDMLLLVGVSAPTHYIERLYIENDGWCYANIKILEEDGLDDAAIQNIRRLKGLLNQGIHPGVSAVIVAYWDSTGMGSDVARKIQSIKSLDITLNPSWKDAQIVDIDYEGSKRGEDERSFSDTSNSPILKAKTFSNVDCGDLLKTSKINGRFTKLKVKEFSGDGMVYELRGPETKSFSAMTLKERVRYAKLSPRMRFRRLIIEYRQLIKQSGGVENIDEETLKIMKSLFTTDVLDIMKTITPDIVKGKQINTLIGASSLGKNVRVAAQKLQLPFRQAFIEGQKQGYLSKMRYQKMRSLYQEFANSLVEEVFGANSSIPQNIEEEEGGEENG